MDEWSLALLSCKLNLIGVEAGGVIKRRGDKGEHAYILLGGGAKVRLTGRIASSRLPYLRRGCVGWSATFQKAGLREISHRRLTKMLFTMLLYPVDPSEPHCG
jgi:hypothetical protein